MHLRGWSTPFALFIYIEGSIHEASYNTLGIGRDVALTKKSRTMGLISVDHCKSNISLSFSLSFFLFLSGVLWTIEHIAWRVGCVRMIRLISGPLTPQARTCVDLPLTATSLVQPKENKMAARCQSLFYLILIFSFEFSFHANCHERNLASLHSPVYVLLLFAPIIP